MSKCGICGSNLILAFTRKGERILICSNVQARVSAFGIANLKQLEMWCDMEITNKQVQPVKTLTKEQEKAVALHNKTNGLQDSFNRLVGADLLARLKKAAYNIIPDDQLLQQANLAIMLELPVWQLPQLFNAAIRLSRTMGISPLKGIEAISKGIGRESRKILDNIGIVFKRSEAYSWFAEQHKLAKLTDTQKSEAWKQYAIKQVIEKAGAVGQPTQKELERKIMEAQQQNGLIKLGGKLNA